MSRGLACQSAYPSPTNIRPALDIRPILTLYRTTFLSVFAAALIVMSSITWDGNERMKDTYRVPVAEADRIRAGLAMGMVAVSTGVPTEAMAAGGRLGASACKARWLAMYLAHVGFGWPLERVAHAFGLNRATASLACRWVEDERDRPVIDRLLDRLEAAVRDVCDAPVFEFGA